MIEAVAAGCVGDEEAKRTVEGLFDNFRQGNWQIVDAIQNIWSGERDADKLTADIDYNSREIVLAILSVLNGENPFEDTEPDEPRPAAPQQQQPQAPPEQEQAMSITDLIKMAALANAPGMPPQIKTQLEQTAAQMANEPAPEINALGRVLQAVLSGDKTPDLTGLPEEMAAAVREMLEV